MIIINIASILSILSMACCATTTTSESEHDVTVDTCSAGDCGSGPADDIASVADACAADLAHCTVTHLEMSPAFPDDPEAALVSAYLADLMPPAGPGDPQQASICSRGIGHYIANGRQIRDQVVSCQIGRIECSFWIQLFFRMGGIQCITLNPSTQIGPGYED